jgi:hypothetical protein
MLPLLNEQGLSAQQVVDMTNQHFNLTTGNQAIIAAENTIGLPEFYLAGPTALRPVSPSTGLPWDANPVCPPA